MSGNSKVQRGTLTPISNSLSLFRTGIEHGSDNQKTCSDRPFAHPKDQANCKQPRKVFAGGMAAQRDAPDSDVKTENMVNDRSNVLCKIRPTSSISQQESVVNTSSAGIRTQGS